MLSLIEEHDLTAIIQDELIDKTCLDWKENEQLISLSRTKMLRKMSLKLKQNVRFVLIGNDE